jgi:TatD DNase family protein
LWGGVTFTRGAPLGYGAAGAPLDRLLVETDCPYLAPVPLRGKRNEPAYVVHTAAVVAALKGLDPEAFARATTENARRLFHLAPRRSQES